MATKTIPNGYPWIPYPKYVGCPIYQSIRSVGELILIIHRGMGREMDTAHFSICFDTAWDFSLPLHILLIWFLTLSNSHSRSEFQRGEFYRSPAISLALNTVLQRGEFYLSFLSLSSSAIFALFLGLIEKPIWANT